MKSIMRALFERMVSEIVTLNIDAAFLLTIMKELVRDYIAEGKLEMAFEAALVTRSVLDQRLVLEACQIMRSGRESTIGAGTLGDIVDWNFQCKVLLACGTNEELRTAVKFMETRGHVDSHYIIHIYTRLYDVRALLRFGNKVAESYFQTLAHEKNTGISNTDKTGIPGQVLEIFEAAKKMGSTAASRELIKFGDRLYAVTGEFKVHQSDSRNGADVPECIRAFELAGTKIALRKAARAYLSINRISDAARCYSLLKDKKRVMEIIRRMISNGNLLEALQLRGTLITEPITPSEMENLFGSATHIRTRRARHK